MIATQMDLLSVADHPTHDEERARIDATIVGSAVAGVVDPNTVRDLLSNQHGLTVTPRTLSARYAVLRKRGVIAYEGWTVNTDRAGGNAGKPLHLYRVVGK